MDAAAIAAVILTIIATIAMYFVSKSGKDKAMA